MFLSVKKTPLCFTNECEIQDIQSSEDSVYLNNIVDAFMATEGMDQAQGWSKLQERTREESGLNDLDISTILTLKRVWANWIESKRKQEINKRGIR